MLKRKRCLGTKLDPETTQRGGWYRRKPLWPYAPLATSRTCLQQHVSQRQSERSLAQSPGLAWVWAFQQANAAHKGYRSLIGCR
jgi:hypothetical protein